MLQKTDLAQFVIAYFNDLFYRKVTFGKILIGAYKQLRFVAGFKQVAYDLRPFCYEKPFFSPPLFLFQ